MIYKRNLTADAEARRKAAAEKAKREAPPAREWPFVETSVSRRFFEAARLCISQNDLSVLFGESGIGKTESCREFVNLQGDAVFLECLPFMSASYLFAKLAGAFELAEHMHLRSCFDGIVSRLKTAQRLIIIDEAEHVSYRGLEMLRRLHDFTRCGMVLVGSPALLSNLRGKDGGGEFRQLFNRVGMAFRLDPINQDDAENLVRAWLPDSGGLWLEFWKAARGDCRRLFKCCRMARHISAVNDCKIDAAVIASAERVLIR